MLVEAKKNEDRQDFIGALRIYAQMLVSNKDNSDARNRAENSISRLEENTKTLGSNAQLLQILRSLVDSGLNRARFFLGILLRDTDPKESVRLFTAAAQEGDRRAMLALGMQWAKGVGVSRADYTEAASWLKRAADLGDPEGMLGYAECLEKGRGAPQDFSGAATLYSKAGALGISRAKSKLGTMLRQGNGVPCPDYAEAFRLFQDAAADGFLEAQGNLGVMYMNGESVPADPAKAVSLWRDGADKGDPICMGFYAMSLEGGAVGPPDFAGAREWYAKAARLGHPMAMKWCTGNGISF
jgi:TPR repeat protein